MNTLFAKILIGFWIGLLAITAALLGLEYAARQRSFPLSPGRGEVFQLYAALATDALEREGRPGLERMLARVETTTRLHAFALDSTGAELSGHAVPRGVALVAGDVLRTNVARRREAKDDRQIGFPLVSPDGTRLALVFEPPQRRGAPPYLPRDLWLRALVVLALGGIGCYVLARTITAPVERLRRATQRLAEGDLAARVGAAAQRGDELADLGRDFDRMAERMESLVSAQRRLLSDISHELRSPLARMNVALGLLRQREVQGLEDLLGRLELEAERLNRLIGDLLTVSRLETGDTAPPWQAVDLSSVAAEVAEDGRLEARGRGGDVHLAAPEPISVLGVPELLRSAIENVVRNAIRYTAGGTAVEIAVGRSPVGATEEAIVEVRDHGPGVPPEHLERIFEPFHRVDDARERRSGGAGLGLAIARRVVLQHGGTIDASRAPAGGLLVRIRLPMHGGALAPAA